MSFHQQLETRKRSLGLKGSRRVQFLALQQCRDYLAVFSIEIFEHIIDYVSIAVAYKPCTLFISELRELLSALKLYALTCKAWKPRSYYYLCQFAFIFLHRKPITVRILNTLQANSDLQSCVQSLTIVHSNHEDVSLAFLVRILGCLPTL